MFLLFSNAQSDILCVHRVRVIHTFFDSTNFARCASHFSFIVAAFPSHTPSIPPHSTALHLTVSQNIQHHKSDPFSLWISSKAREAQQWANERTNEKKCHEKSIIGGTEREGEDKRGMCGCRRIHFQGWEVILHVKMVERWEGLWMTRVWKSWKRFSWYDEVNYFIFIFSSHPRNFLPIRWYSTSNSHHCLILVPLNLLLLILFATDIAADSVLCSVCILYVIFLLLPFASAHAWVGNIIEFCILMLSVGFFFLFSHSSRLILLLLSYYYFRCINLYSFYDSQGSQKEKIRMWGVERMECEEKRFPFFIFSFRLWFFSFVYFSDFTCFGKGDLRRRK